MIQDQKRQTLAETLARSGLAASAGEAARMADSIIGTESRVSQHFDKQNQKIDDSLTRKKTYQEEIDELIEKTSMEKKDFHVMVSGYKKDKPKDIETPKIDVEAPRTEIIEEESKVEVVDMPEEKTEIKEYEDLVKEPELKVEPSIEEKEEVHHELEEAEVEESTPEIKEEPKIEKPIFVQDLKPKGNDDILDDERTLMEIMSEDAQDVYTNKQEKPKQEIVEEKHEVEETPEYNMVNVESPSFETNTPEIEESREKEDEFIIGESAAQPKPEPVQEISEEPDQVLSNQPEEQPEQMFKEIKENKPANAPPAKPIDDVDLMDYFKFG